MLTKDQLNFIENHNDSCSGFNCKKCIIGTYANNINKNKTCNVESACNKLKLNTDHIFVCEALRKYILKEYKVNLWKQLK